MATSLSDPWCAQQATLVTRLPLAAPGPDEWQVGTCATVAWPLLLRGDQHGPPFCPDESDYQTEYEEELPDGSKDTYADFQSAPAHLGSDSVSCLDLPVVPLS